MQESAPPKVSVVMPFYNCAYVAEAIESVLNQTYPHIELIVVDDGSTKHTGLVEPYKSRIRYIRKENGGTATALNEGIRQATGEYFCWLSSDDMFAPWKTVEQLWFMQEHDAMISCTKWNIMDSTSKIYHYNEGPYLPERRAFLQRLAQTCFINGCTVMAKMELFDKIGLFDETLRYAHDYDLWVRAAKQYPFHSMNMTLVNYRRHEAMGSVRFSGPQQEEARLVQQKHRADLLALLQQVN